MTRESLAPEQRYAAAVVGILVLILLLVVTLTWQVWRAARAQRSTVDVAIADQATFAAETYRSRLTAQFYSALTNAFRHVARVPPRDHAALETLQAGIDAAVQCKCGPALQSRALFLVDLATAAVAAMPSRRFTSGSEDSLLARAIIEHARQVYADESPPFVMFAQERDGRLQLLSYTVLRDRSGSVRWALGFEIDLAQARRAIFEPAHRVTLFPGTRIDPGTADSLYAVSVRTASGRSIHESRAHFTNQFAGRAVMPPFLGSLSIVVALNSRSMRSRFSPFAVHTGTRLLGALLLLAGSLLAAILVLMWRTTTLARLRADFTASVSHELRTPLSQIMLFAETMALGRLSSVGEYRRESRVILQESQRLLHLVENVLHFARAERLSMPLRRTSQLLAPILRATGRDFAPLAAESDLIIRTSIDERVGAHVDSAAIRRALGNLLENALKYGDSGQQVVLGLTLERGCARLTVDDRGPGVPVRERKRIWKPFQRLTRDIELARAGSGIGLAIVHDIVRSHGGRAWVEDSTLGGARFVIELPAAWRAEGRDSSEPGDPVEPPLADAEHS